jgi:light-regulated signal transduction histidine kinase (bacteriophytochrome)
MSVNRNESIIHVKDNGAGFDMRYAKKLFDIFQRLHSPDEFEGVGAGLAIVKKIILKHGGRIWFKSKKNVGTEVSFSIPLEH